MHGILAIFLKCIFQPLKYGPYHVSFRSESSNYSLVIWSVSVFLQHVTLGTVWGRVSIWHKWFAAPPRARWGWRWRPPRGRAWGCCGQASRPGPAPASRGTQVHINRYIYIIRGWSFQQGEGNKRRLLKIPQNVNATLSHSFLLSPGSGEVSTRGLLTDFSDSRKYKLSALSS